MSEWATFDQLLLEAEQCLEAIRDTLVAGPTETQVHGIVRYLEGVIEAISMVDTSLPETELTPFLDAVTELTSHLHLYIQTDIEVYTATTTTSNTTRLDILSQHLSFLVECGFTLKDTATFFNCSTKTIQRRITEFGLQDIWSFTDISQDDLDEIASLYNRSHPGAGYINFQAFLCSQGLKVRRQHVRESM